MSGRLINLDAWAQGNAGLKVGWAKHHLRALDDRMGAFLKSNPYAVTAKDDLERRQHVLRLDIAPIPVELGLIVGDFACCLRSSLDHLAYALTLIPGGSPNDRAYFPVLERWNPGSRKQFNNATSGIPAQVVAVIQSLQPYHGGDAYKASKL